MVWLPELPPTPNPFEQYRVTGPLSSEWAGKGGMTRYHVLSYVQQKMWEKRRSGGKVGVEMIIFFM